MAILYKSSRFYHTLMAIVYRGNRQQRFKAVAKWIPENTKVLDVCCGDGSLAGFIPASAQYRGLDQSKAFVKEARQKGRDVSEFDLLRDRLPESDIVVCQVSLFQFYPDIDAVLSRLFDASRQRLIISESVLSLTQSRWKWIANLVAWGTDPNGMSNSRFRFNPESLNALFAPYKTYIKDASEVCGGRDWVYVLDKP